MELTGILGIYVPLPWDRGIDEWAWGVLVEEYREVYGNLGAAPASDIGRQGSE